MLNQKSCIQTFRVQRSPAFRLNCPTADRKEGLTPAQLRAARGLLNISQAEVAGVTGLSLSTIRQAERDRKRYGVSPASLALIVEALQAADVEFLDGNAPGVRMGGGERNPRPHPFGYLINRKVNRLFFRAPEEP